MNRSNRRGGVLIESAVALLLLTLSFGAALELIRRAHYELVFHHAAFLAVRERALGASLGKVRAVAHDFLREALREGHGGRVAEKVRWSEERRENGGKMNLYYRYPAFFRFPLRHSTKHHLEITRSCLFPF